MKDSSLYPDPNKTYRELTAEEKKAYHKAYYQKNKEEIKKQSRENRYAARMERRSGYHGNDWKIPTSCLQTIN